MIDFTPQQLVRAKINPDDAKAVLLQLSFDPGAIYEFTFHRLEEAKQCNDWLLRGKLQGDFPDWPDIQYLDLRRLDPQEAIAIEDFTRGIGGVELANGERLLSVKSNQPISQGQQVTIKRNGFEGWII